MGIGNIALVLLKPFGYLPALRFTMDQLFKGQLISKWFFGVVDFLQKTNKNKSHTMKNEFIHSFFGENR